MALITIRGNAKIERMTVTNNKMYGGDGTIIDAHGEAEMIDVKIGSNISIDQSFVELLEAEKSRGLSKDTAIANVLAAMGNVADLVGVTQGLGILWDTFTS